MAGNPSVAIVRDIQTLFDAGTSAGLTDRQLLERFTNRRDASSDTAFEVLISRHGPMVLRVCRNLLREESDVADAFQATFLVLVRKRETIRRLESVGGWLYGVACRVAARRGSTRRGGKRPNAGPRFESWRPSIRGMMTRWREISARSCRRKCGGCLRNTERSLCCVTGSR